MSGASLPSGTVTFLFTDVEASTRLWEDHPDEMSLALQSHDRILRSSIEDSGGHVFSTAGDAFSAAFPSAAGALEAANSAQGGLSSADWPGPVRLRVRMGLHTGTADERDGDYFGPTLNRAARIMSAAHGGQVIASAAVADLAGADADLVPLGEHRLRDLSAPERLYQLGAALFPPLRTLDAIPGNLPSALTELIGRDEDLGALAELLQSERLVTLAGPGGVGKTRLALAIAGQIAGGFRDGAWFVDLASVASDGDVAAAAVRTLGAPATGEASDVLKGWLMARETLLVIDNCEHVVDAAADLVDDLLSAGPGIRVLTTSRELLDLPGEARWEVTPLIGEASVDLFVDRAHRIRPDLDLDEHRDRVTEICADLDGMPLAVELAAAMLRTLSIAELVDSLSERLDLLRGGRRTAPRHRTLRATVEWSYDLLPRALRDPFCRLAAIAAPFDVDGCSAVTGLSRSEAMRTLDDLIARSMVVAETTDLGTRYRLLDTLRTFGRERLGVQLEVVERLAATHFLDWIETISHDLEGPDDIAAWDLVDNQWPNIVASTEWFLRADEPERAAQITVACLTSVVTLRTHVRDWVRRLDGEQLEPPEEQGIHCAGVVDAWLDGRVDDCRRHLARAIELADQIEISHPSLQWTSGIEAYIRGAADEMIAALDPDLDPGLAEFWRCQVAMMRVFGLLIAGRTEQAAVESASVRQRAEALRNTYQVMTASFASGRVHIERGELQEAVAYYEQAIDLAERIRNRFIPMVSRGILASGLARSARPLECLGQLGLCIRDGLGGTRPDSVATAWFNYAAIAFHDIGRLDDAAWCLAVTDGRQTYSTPTPDELAHLERLRAALAGRPDQRQPHSPAVLDDALQQLKERIDAVLASPHPSAPGQS